jgi:hypothetical protein
VLDLLGDQASGTARVSLITTRGRGSIALRAHGLEPEVGASRDPAADEDADERRDRWVHALDDLETWPRECRTPPWNDETAPERGF